MNILAHAYLSDRRPGLLIGNFIADFVKGDPAHARHGLRPDEVAGIRLHRAIDTFTDAHPAVAAVRALLYPRCRKYAGVAVDVFFDHYLARRFAALTGEPLPAFVDFFYATLRAHHDRLPAGARRMADAMIAQDWLGHYQTFDGINQALTGLSRRTAYPSGLDTAVADLRTHYGAIGRLFGEFWPELTIFVAQYVASTAPDA